MKNKITQEDIDSIVERTQWTVEEFHGKCTVVVARLPNGFILTESSACVDPTNYDVNIGMECCKKRIIDKIWLLEGYRLQCRIPELTKIQINLDGRKLAEEMYPNTLEALKKERLISE